MKYFVLLLSVLFLSNSQFAQSYKINGNVTDAATGLPVAEVNISISEIHLTESTTLSGSFTIHDIVAGEYTITFSRIGYRSEKTHVSLPSDEGRNLEIRLTPAPLTLNDIIVTSTRYETSLKNVSLPMEVMTGQRIEALAAVTVSDLIKDKPGVSLSRDGIWGTTVNIRGLSRSSIVTLIDGSRIETATDLSAGLSLIDVNNIQRIEIIKGAASSLYGTGALGGIVNIITRNGQYNDHFFIGGSLLSGYNSVNNSGTGNISLNAGASSWFARLSGSLRKADNTKTPAGTLLNSQYQDNSLSADVAVKPIENQELKISFQRVRAENVGIPGGNSLFSSIAEVRYPSEERQLLKAEYNLHNISGTLSNVSIRYYYQYILRDVENIPHTVSKTPAQGSQPAKETDVLKITPNARHYTNGLQLQTDWVTGKQNFIIAGIDAWQRKLDSRRERYIRVLTMNAKGDSVAKTVNQIVGERPLPESSFRSIGLYLQDELELIKDELKITLGGRFDQIHVTNQEVSNPVYLIVNGQRNDAPATRTIYWKEGKENNYSWSGNLGLLYSVSQGLNLNFTAARSFRSPSLEERYKYIDLGSLVQLGDPALKPEEGLFLDAGLRVFDDRLSCTFDAFLNSLTNMVAEKPGTYEGRPALINSNIGKARLYGFDLGADYYVTGRVNLYTTASLVSGRDIEKDQYLPQVPPFNGKLGVRVPVYEYGEVDFSGTVFSAQNNVAAGEIKTPGYTYFDLYLNSAPVNFGDIKLKFYGGVENLTDKAYRNHLATNRGLTAIEPGRNFFVKCVLAW